MARSLDIWRQHRAERMRLGQAVCTIENLLSDPDVRVALVPITDAEHQNALTLASITEAGENEHGAMRRDRTMQIAVIHAAAREVDDLTKPFFESMQEVSELPHFDIVHLWDCYSEMVFQSSPSIEMLDQKELEELKKVLQQIEWSELSGRSWYAAKRFLTAVSLEPRLVRSLGFSFSSGSTTTSTETTSAPSADQS